MKTWKKIILIFTAVLLFLPLGSSVLADDDDDDHEKHEYYQKKYDDDGEDDNDDDDNWEPNQQTQISPNQQNDYWYLWSREPRNNPENPLPISTPSDLIVSLNNNEKSIYFIPQEGQLLVSAKEIADLLGADMEFYQQSKIGVMKIGGKELIIRAGTNAAYENRMKTPMPAAAGFYENSLYLPISVAANALGYRINWDEANMKIILQSI